MEKATTNIKNEKIRTYFDDVTEGKEPTVVLTADEIEQGVNAFDEGMRKIIKDADERLMFRKALQDLSEKMEAINDKGKVLNQQY